MAIRITYRDNQAGPRFRHGMLRQADRVRAAVRLTVEEVAGEIERRGRADIAGAGNFGSRWTDGLHATPGFGGGNVNIRVTHDMGAMFGIFEHGGVIHGKPLLWIPLSFSDAVGIRARDYGNLFRVDRLAGAPLLLSSVDREPKYFGKESVTMPRKFHVRDIAAQVGRTIGEIYRKYFVALGTRK